MTAETLDGMIGTTTSILISSEGIFSIAVTEMYELMLIVLTVVEVYVHVLFCHN